jgi:hypothetical protein
MNNECKFGIGFPYFEEHIVFSFQDVDANGNPIPMNEGTLLST